MGTRLVFQAITDVIPLQFSGIVAENHEHVECDALHEQVPCLAPEGVVNYALQILPQIIVNLLSQDLVPMLPFFFQKEVGVVLQNLADIVPSLLPEI